MTLTVAHVNVARGYRGGERQTELLIRALAASEFRQILVAKRGAPLIERMRDAPVEVRPVSGGAWSVIRATSDVDLVHVHEGRSVYAAFLRSLISQTPYIITRRVNNPIGDHWLAHKAYTQAAHLVAVAGEVRNVIQAFDEAAQVEVIHSCSSDLSFDTEAAAEIRARYGGGFLVGQVSALDNAQKGQEYTIAVARELADSHPDVQFLLVGGGKDEQMLKQLAAGLPNVTFTGFVENVGDYLGALDVFVLPSNREGIAAILLDAMDRGLPVVASRVGGVPELVRDGSNGILIDAGAVGQLRDAILKLRESPQLSGRLGDEGRRFARTFTASEMAAKYLALYRSALGDTASEADMETGGGS